MPDVKSGAHFSPLSILDESESAYKAEAEKDAYVPVTWPQVVVPICTIADKITMLK
jgi:hypothetical protein